MLTKRLRDKELFESDIREEEVRQDALRLLDTAVEQLIRAMVTVENTEAYEREEIENYVMRRMEYYEALLYGMDDEEFTEYMADKLLDVLKEALR